MYKVLIIDDDPRIRLTIKAALEIFAGWEALVAVCGQEGLDIAQREQPDAILLDVMMPEMDGITTLQYLQANLETQSIPVILCTAITQEVERQNFAQLPITGIISKPFEATELVEQIYSLLNWQK